MLGASNPAYIGLVDLGKRRLSVRAPFVPWTCDFSGDDDGDALKRPCSVTSFLFVSIQIEKEK